MAIVPQLAGRFQQDGVDVPILGYVTFWNVRDVCVKTGELASLLNGVGLPSAYVRPHNYRSSFIRALRSLEEQRIIRPVEEDANRMVYQFTAEKRGSADGDVALDYERETVIVIDKNVYRDTGDFAKALIRGREDVRNQIAILFNEERDTYRSSDLSRAIQNIFQREGDLLSLRPQGTVYFVPAAHRNLIDAVSNLATSIVGLTFQYVPIIDIPSSRQMVAGAVKLEFEDLLEKLDEEIAEVTQGATEKWVEHRKNRLTTVTARLERYASIMERSEISNLKDGLVNLERKLADTRVLDL